MAQSPPHQIRLRPILLAYIDELVSIGYGKDRSAVIRRFIEDGVIRAIENKVVEKRNVDDFPDEGA